MSVIAFETATSELLGCSCGNDVMSSGFDHRIASDCELVHYVCNSCQASACVDYVNRIVTGAGHHALSQGGCGGSSTQGCDCTEITLGVY